MISRSRLILLAIFLLAGSAAPPASVRAAVPIVPLPDEAVLSRAERSHAVDTMRANERVALRAIFDAHATDLLVLSYERRLIRVATTAEGRQEPEDVVKPRHVPGSSLRVPDESVAGYAKKEDLYISLTVTRSRTTAPYEWRVWTYAEWRDGLRGMNVTNGSADSMALAWAGGATLHSQTASGSRYEHWPCNSAPLEEWPSDGSPNLGTAWSFHEFGTWGCPMHWVLADIRIRHDSLIGRTDNLVYKYFHTYGGLEYDFTFSKSPGISISPTREQWSLALFASYRH